MNLALYRTDIFRLKTIQLWKSSKFQGKAHKFVPQTLEHFQISFNVSDLPPYLDLSVIKSASFHSISRSKREIEFQISKRNKPCKAPLPTSFSGYCAWSANFMRVYCIKGRKLRNKMLV